MAVNCCFIKGKYDSHDEFLQALKAFESQTFTVFNVRKSESATTANASRKLFSKSPIPARFKIYRAFYTCSHYGTYKSRSKGIMKKTSSRASGCPACFTVMYSHQLCKLYILSGKLEHNHEANEATYARQYKVKRLSEEEVQSLKEMFGEDQCPSNDQLLKVIQGTFGRAFSPRDVRDLKYRWKPRVDQDRQAERPTERSVRAWFTDVERQVAAIDTATVHQDPARIFCCDDTWYPLGGHGEQMVAFNSRKTLCEGWSDPDRRISVLVCGSARGHVLDPLLIYRGRLFSYNPRQGFPSAHFTQSPSGRVDGEIFESWLRQVFVPHVDAWRKPVILVVEEHKVTPRVKDLCRQNQVIVYPLPRGSAPLLQPLQLLTFPTLRLTLNSAVLEHQETFGVSPGKEDFAALFRRAWDVAVTLEGLTSGFCQAGIHPWDPEVVGYSKCRNHTSTIARTGQGQPTACLESLPMKTTDQCVVNSLSQGTCVVNSLSQGTCAVNSLSQGTCVVNSLSQGTSVVNRCQKRAHSQRFSPYASVRGSRVSPATTKVNSPSLLVSPSSPSPPLTLLVSPSSPSPPLTLVVVHRPASTVSSRSQTSLVRTTGHSGRPLAARSSQRPTCQPVCW
ncbi:uncharacterized protein LOC101846264 [Aplysia californica]|uniref:Uncharacterized protein LOC101846264 n=1 Tax=Aplysia californica TaxID=6500 RepID=A0ABM0KAJ4_APLCA|nr:uncharacterized protein LOC101846264 [Aplysia californica]